MASRTFKGASVVGIGELNKKLGEIIKRASGESRDEGVSVIADHLIDVGRTFVTNDYANAYFDGEKDITIKPVYGRPNEKPWELIASGTMVLFVEFGTGILLNEGDHPLGAEFGFTPTSWSATHMGYLVSPKIERMKVQGSWPHGKDADGKTEWHYGNPPSKTMYYGAKLMRRELGDTAETLWKRH